MSRYIITHTVDPHLILEQVEVHRHTGQFVGRATGTPERVALDDIVKAYPGTVTRVEAPVLCDCKGKGARERQQSRWDNFCPDCRLRLLPYNTTRLSGYEQRVPLPTDPEGRGWQLIFVYGSLKRGGWLNRILTEDRSAFAGAGRIAGYTLASLGAFPGAIPSAGASVTGEFYWCSKEQVTRLDNAESEGSMYRRVAARVPEGPEGVQAVQMYEYACPDAIGLTVVGDTWVLGPDGRGAEEMWAPRGGGAVVR